MEGALEEHQVALWAWPIPAGMELDFKVSTLGPQERTLEKIRLQPAAGGLVPHWRHRVSHALMSGSAM